MAALESDLATVEREVRKHMKVRDLIAQTIAKEQFGYDLPAVHKFVVDGVAYEINVWASVRKVGREDESI